MLQELPRRVWLETSIAAAKATVAGWALELSDSNSTTSAGGGQLRAFLARDTLKTVGRDLGMTLDPALLVGMTTCLLVEPLFSPRWHLQGRILGVSQDACTSLARRATEQLRQDLKASGLYDRQRRLPTPPDVTRVAVIAPSGAAGHADIAGELARWQAAGILERRTFTAPFEGERAAAALTAALMAAAEPVGGVRPDLILVVRGGGATTGLRALDHEAIVRALCRCPVPVIIGVGHASDRSLADEVAWHAADTPSKAVARAARLISAPAARARDAVGAIGQAAEAHLTTHEAQLFGVQTHVLAAARQRLEGAQADLHNAGSTLSGSADRLRDALQHHEHEVEHLQQTCAAQARGALDAATDACRRTLEALVADAERRAAAADAGQAALVAVTRAAMAWTAAALSSCEALWRDILGRAGDHLTAAQADLAGRASEIAATDAPVQLRRGFAVVLDARGHLIRTPAAAVAARRVTLMLAGGAVAALVEPLSPATTPGART